MSEKDLNTKEQGQFTRGFGATIKEVAGIFSGKVEGGSVPGMSDLGAGEKGAATMIKASMEANNKVISDFTKNGELLNAAVADIVKRLNENLPNIDVNKGAAATAEAAGKMSLDPKDIQSFSKGSEDLLEGARMLRSIVESTPLTTSIKDIFTGSNQSMKRGSKLTDEQLSGGSK